MIAIDTNILVYSHRQDSTFFPLAQNAISSLIYSNKIWGIAWPCINEFLSIVTNKKIFKTPTPLALAIEQVNVWKNQPNFRLLVESGSEEYFKSYMDILLKSNVQGGQIHDARVASLCVYHNATLWTADRDFNHFNVKIFNPLK